MKSKIGSKGMLCWVKVLQCSGWRNDTSQKHRLTLTGSK